MNNLLHFCFSLADIDRAWSRMVLVSCMLCSLMFVLTNSLAYDCCFLLDTICRPLSLSMTDVNSSYTGFDTMLDIGAVTIDGFASSLLAEF